MLVSVAARGNSSSSSAPKQEGDVKEITVWAWGPTLTQVAKDFKKETGINVNLVNTGQGNKTWDEFYQDAKKIHTLGDNYYITSDTGGAGFYDSMTWLASATPFSTEGETSCEGPSPHQGGAFTYLHLLQRACRLYDERILPDTSSTLRR